MVRQLNTARQLKQVAITYVTHRYIWAGALFGLVVVIGPLVAMLAHNGPTAASASAITSILGMPLLFGLPFLVGHAKTQFVHSRSRLIPGFTFPHIAALAGLLILLLFGFPMLIAWSGHVGPSGVIALTLAVSTPVIWGVHRSRMSLFVVALAVYYSLFTGQGRDWWIVDAADHWQAHVLIIAAGVVLIAAWLRRLFQLREGMDDYQTVVKWRVARPGGSEAIERRRASAAQVCRSPLITWINDHWLARLPFTQTGGGQLQLPRLLLYGFGPWPTEFQAIVMTLMFAAVTVFMADFAYWAKGSEAGSLSIFLFFTTVMPGFLGGEALAQRRPRIAAELLRPLTRNQLIDGLFAAAARNAVVNWLIMNAGLLLVAWHVLGRQLTPPTIATYVLVSVATSFAAWGLSARMAVWQSHLKRLILMMFVWGAASGLVQVWLATGKTGEWPFVILAIVLAAIGALLVASARRAWLNLEIG